MAKGIEIVEQNSGTVTEKKSNQTICQDDIQPDIAYYLAKSMKE